MKPNKRIALIICYYGKFPWYFDYFAHTCSYNPTVDFFVVTDSHYKKALPNNVKLVYKSLIEVSQLATAKLGFEVNIKHGYKLCDFKPAFGFIFPELIDGYHFWGHCDIDVVFGNIRNFLTDDILDNHDLISVRPDWIPGCFLLFKNSIKMNTLFLQSKDYKKVFTGDKHYCFDETNFAHREFEDGKTYDQVNTEIESMMHVVKKLEAAACIKPYFDLHIIEGGRPGKLRWTNGNLIYKNKFEVLLYHLIVFKKYYISKKKINHISSSFTISPTRIVHPPTPKPLIDELPPF